MGNIKLSRLGSLSVFPRVKLVIAPTPIEELFNLSKMLDGPRIFVKRDDLTGLAFGGNKVRQLEFYMGEAQSNGADTILTTGAVQSNFVRTAAAAAAKLGMHCHVQLEERVENIDETHRNSGNVLLNRLMGAKLYSFHTGEDESGADSGLEKIAKKLRLKGKNPYIISLSPGHSAIGALGYIVCAQEIIEQLEKSKVKIDKIFCGSGSAATHAGLIFGLRALQSNISVIGVCVRRSAEKQFTRVLNKCNEIADLLGIKSPVVKEDILTTDTTFYPGYGCLNDGTIEALQLSASLEGLILDPVYTGKVMAGLIHCVRLEKMQNETNILFLHTGGQPSLFAYEPELRFNYSLVQ